MWTLTANGANKRPVFHVRLRCGSLSITTPVSLLANEFDVQSVLHGQVSLAAFNQIYLIHEAMNGCKNLKYHWRLALSWNVNISDCKSNICHSFILLLAVDQQRPNIVCILQCGLKQHLYKQIWPRQFLKNVEPMIKVMFHTSCL